MHMQGEPRTMQDTPHYEDVVTEVETFLVRRIDEAMAAGIARERIYIDPGFGFGKTLDHNLALMRALPRLARLAPVLVGVSRKSLIGELTGRPVERRLAGSLAAALAALADYDVISVTDPVPQNVTQWNGQPVPALRNLTCWHKEA
jgi:dihydropteroate synthase